MGTRQAHRSTSAESRPGGAATVRRRTLRVGAADDAYERQADATAAQVMRRLGGSDTTGTSAAAGASGVATLQRRTAPEGAMGPAGGELDTRTSETIEAARGGGQALAEPTRQRMEQAFGGADFSAVRVHSGGESEQLNDRLGAQAFTVGRDVFLGRGSPALGSAAGEHLLAHELTHTVQQGGGAQRTTLRRLSLSKLQTSKITSARVAGDGASGMVALITDGSKGLVVKANQTNAAEVLAADKIQQKVAKKSGKTFVAPKSRLASSHERQKLWHALAPLLPADTKSAAFLDALDQGPGETLISEMLKGQNLDKEVAKGSEANPDYDANDTKSKKKQPSNDFDVVMTLMSSVDTFETFGRIVAGDVVMGMTDRILGQGNLQNIMYDAATGRFALPDNTALTEQGWLTTSQDTLGQTTTGEDAFKNWYQRIYQTYVGGGVDGMADLIVPEIKAVVKTALGDVPLSTVTAAFKKAGDTMGLAVRTGLDAGFGIVAKVLADPVKIVAGLPRDKRREAAINLVARREVLFNGADADTAWARATAWVEKKSGLPKPKAPKQTTVKKKPPKKKLDDGEMLDAVYSGMNL